MFKHLAGHRRQTLWSPHRISTLATEFDDAARRNVEELGRRLRVAVHEIKHLPPEAAKSPRFPTGSDS